MGGIKCHLDNIRYTNILSNACVHLSIFIFIWIVLSLYLIDVWNNKKIEIIRTILYLKQWICTTFGYKCVMHFYFIFKERIDKKRLHICIKDCWKIKELVKEPILNYFGKTYKFFEDFRKNYWIFHFEFIFLKLETMCSLILIFLKN